jgi:uncharacterized membrane protein YjgN (DUF898 family)
MLVLFGLYAVSSYVSNWVALGAFVVLALLWPALWRSSLMFRMGNTSWRGLRMSFEGTLADAYGAMLPLFIPALVILSATAWFMNGVDPKDVNAVQAANAAAAPFAGLSMLVLAAMFPWAMWRIKRYQHGGYRLAQQATTFTGRVRAFYWLGLKLALVVVLVAVVVGVGAGAIVALLRTTGAGKVAMAGALVPFALLVAAMYVWLFSLAGAGLQNLAWNPTRSSQLQFASSLRVMSLTGMNLLNLVLMILTIGLYRPFAVVNVLRLRLEAVQVHSSGSVEALAVGRPRAGRHRQRRDVGRLLRHRCRALSRLRPGTAPRAWAGCAHAGTTAARRAPRRSSSS